jgi:lysophospholipase L1-like esterase
LLDAEDMLMKIICFGDSLTEGDYGGSYVRTVQAQLPQHEIVNAGVGGNTVVNLARRLERDVLHHEPDAVFLMVGGNDAISYSQPKTRSYYKNAQRIEDGVVPPDLFAQTYRQIVETLQLAHIQVLIGLEPIEYNDEVVAAFAQYMATADMIARAHNLPVLDLRTVFPTPHPLPQRPPLDVSFILTIGARMQRGWRDYAAARDAGSYTFSFDGLHFTEESAERAGAAIARFVQQHLG